MKINALEEQTSPFEMGVRLDAEEADALAEKAWERMSCILKCDRAHVERRTEEMLTAREIQEFLKETIMALAGEKAIAAAAPLFVDAPEFTAAASFAKHRPFDFRIAVYPVPDMELDCETPIERKGSATAAMADADLARETLRARLHGTFPERLLRKALERKKAAFQQQLADKGLTYREYRIAHRVKPSEVEDALADEAFDELAADIALDLVFIRQELACEEDDYAAALAQLAPGKEQALRDELSATGKTWMLEQKTRRAVALDWAVAHLVERNENR